MFLRRRDNVECTNHLNVFEHSTITGVENSTSIPQLNRESTFRYEAVESFARSLVDHCLTVSVAASHVACPLDATRSCTARRRTHARAHDAISISVSYRRSPTSTLQRFRFPGQTERRTSREPKAGKRSAKSNRRETGRRAPHTGGSRETRIPDRARPESHETAAETRRRRAPQTKTRRLESANPSFSSRGVAAGEPRPDTSGIRMSFRARVVESRPAANESRPEIFRFPAPRVRFSIYDRSSPILKRRNRSYSVLRPSARTVRPSKRNSIYI